MLIQQRSATKLTFPLTWSNTCCSHPLADRPAEHGLDNPAAAEMGVRHAAIRRVAYELGITGLQPSDILHAGRFLYAAFSDRHWGEHESIRIVHHLIIIIVDHLLFAQAESNNLRPQPNPDEVATIDHVGMEALSERMTAAPETFTPWFRLVMKDLLMGKGWWEKYIQGKTIENGGIYGIYYSKHYSKSEISD